VPRASLKVKAQTAVVIVAVMPETGGATVVASGSAAQVAP
jgi:hypothetical protein